MTLCYTGTSDCFEALLVVVVEEDLVWPGDTDSDGIANHFDILNIGLGYGDYRSLNDQMPRPTGKDSLLRTGLSRRPPAE